MLAAKVMTKGSIVVRDGPGYKCQLPRRLVRIPDCLYHGPHNWCYNKPRFFRNNAHGQKAALHLGLAAFRLYAAGHAIATKSTLSRSHEQPGRRHVWGPVKLDEQCESTIFIDDEQRMAVLRGVFDNYYASTEGDVIFDTNRGWCSKLPALAQLFSEAKIICCVRDIVWVLDSFERMYLKNPMRRSKMFNEAEGGTVYGRVDSLAHRSRTVGFAWTALKEAFYGKWSASLLLVEYELLAAEPDQTMGLIYQFLDEPLYTHDFENFEYQETNFDENLGVPGLHDVHGPVKLVRRPPYCPTNCSRNTAI